MKALFIVDPQIDFCPGGALAVPEGDAIFNYINTLTAYPLKIVSKDMHPKNHKSFASNNPGKRAFMDVIQLNGEEVRLWPDHCVVGTPGAEIHPALTLKPDYTVHKGMGTHFNNYSPFFNNSQSPEKQGEILDAAGQPVDSSSLLDFLTGSFDDELVDTIDVVGLATDYCVKAFVLDALKYDFRVRLLVPGCRGVNVNPTDVANAIEEMRKAGAEIVDLEVKNTPADGDGITP